ncbi:MULTISPECIES: hypothetical protein [unclassified Myroides]|uniref:hypothetical protein n=1 Tax=unclassified Myroides TaxID=2642485 RepID=UPI003D2F9733
MIAGGGLSGGISSTIAGGDFWYGMRQGLIVSGLNHVVHMSEVKAYQLQMSLGDIYIESNPVYLNHLNKVNSNNWQF